MEKRHDIQSLAFMLLIASLLIAVSNPPALAHKVTIFAWVEGNTVYTESKFMGGNKVRNAQIMVFDGEGMQLLEGTTNESGEFSFKVPKLADLTVVLNAGMGHRAEWTITESEIREGSGTSKGEPAPKTSQQRAVGLNKEEIKELIEDSLDRKLRPIMRMIAESRSRGPSVTEIVGGIGYIFGLMGLALYFRNRIKEKQKDNRDD
jgi:nickel transport protein